MYRIAVMKDNSRLPSNMWPMLTEDNRFSVEHICADYDAALEHLAKNPADIMLLDLRERPEQGLELVRRLRSRDIGVDVIALIKGSKQRVAQRAFQLGAVDCIAEPFDTWRVQRALDRFVLRAGLEDNRQRLTQEAIDNILQGNSEPRNTLPKGLQETTLALVRKVLECSPESGLSCEDISSAVGLSRITVQRYLSHLCERGEIVRSINYYTGGRPCTLYRRALAQNRYARPVRNIV